VHQWIREHPGECVRAPVDREGNMLARTAAVAVLVQPCVEERLPEMDPPACEVRELELSEVSEEPGISEVPLPEIELVPEDVLAVDGVLVTVSGYVSAGVPAPQAVEADIVPPADYVVPIFVREEPKPPERPRKRGLWKRLFGKKRNR
jgi:hypothetical protein